MRSLGLDPSLTGYGWCIYDSDATLGSHRLVISGHEGTLKGTIPVTRFIHFRSMVADLLTRFRVDVVGIETPVFNSGPFMTDHFGLMMFSLEAIFNARKDCVLFDPTTLKLLSTGKSDASKQDMQKAVQLDRMTTDLVQSDESDAYMIARFASRFMMLKNCTISPDELDENEQQIFLRRSKKKNGGIKHTAQIFRENSRFYEFSRVPKGSINLPKKSDINQGLLEWLEAN
jgi:Holliday junction resolvasome RuvABC endonuclease subunit